MPPAPGTLVTWTLPEMPSSCSTVCIGAGGLVPAAAGRGRRHDRVVGGEGRDGERAGERGGEEQLFHGIPPFVAAGRLRPGPLPKR